MQKKYHLKPRQRKTRRDDKTTNSLKCNKKNSINTEHIHTSNITAHINKAENTVTQDYKAEAQQHSTETHSGGGLFHQWCGRAEVGVTELFLRDYVTKMT